jgi:transposase
VPAKITRIPRNARRRLVRLGRSSGDPATFERFRIIALLGVGHGVTEVARMLDVAVAHVSRTQSRFLRGGVDALYDQRRFNGVRKVTSAFLCALAELLARSPPDFKWMRPTWTRELLCIEMACRGFGRVAVCTMGRALHLLGARLGRPKPVVICPWSRERRELVLKQIRDLEAHASVDEPVLYADEIDIHKNPKIGRDWMLRGHQRRIVTPGKNEKFYLAGALDVVTGRVHAVGDFSKSSRLFVQLLNDLARRYPRARRVHVILDNYIIHKSRAAERAMLRLGGRIRLHFLPPYCPDHNRIERVWLELHANVTRNHRCRTMRALLANARAFIDAYRWRAGHSPLQLQAAA